MQNLPAREIESPKQYLDLVAKKQLQRGLQNKVLS